MSERKRMERRDRKNIFVLYDDIHSVCIKPIMNNSVVANAGI